MKMRPLSLLTAGVLLVSTLVGAASEVTLIPGGKPLIPTGSPGWSYRLGTSEASTPIELWRTNNFVMDGTWSPASLPMGYGSANDPNGYEGILVTTLPTSTVGNYLSVFVRKTFVVTNVARFAAITLGLAVDDGCVAWINGREMTPRFQCCEAGDIPSANPAIPTFDADSTTTGESAYQTNTMVNGAGGPLVEGTNVLCIQLFNGNLTSSDIILDAELKATIDDSAPVITSVIPDRGTAVRTLTQVEVLFSKPVTGVDAADLLVNGTPATGITFGAPNQFAFSFPQPSTTGTVTFAFASNHGIADQAPAPNAFAGDNWTVTLNTNLAFIDVRINEFMADNANGIRAEDGSHQDWIELYNAGSTAVNLAGWFLTDDAINLNKWRFPTGVQMNPGAYLIGWASGNTNIGPLHTNFKLAKNAGSYLALVLPDGTNVVSAFVSYPQQQTDASYGRDRLDPNIVGFYDVPSPGAANPTGGSRSGFAPDVTFSLSSRTFVTPFSLTLSTTATNAVIRYVLITTAAGASASVTNIPTTNSPIYTGAIPVSVTTEVRARAFQTGLFPGTPRTENFIQINNDVKNFSSDIPVVIVHALGNGSIPQVSPNLSSIFMAFDNDGRRSSVTNTPQAATRMGMHVRGSSTLGQAKSNLRLEFWDDFNQDIDLPLLGMPAESDWVLYGINGFDPGLMHNAIYQWLGKQVGIFNMRTRFVEVFRKIDSGPVTTNDYFGLYLLLETPKVGKDRVDIVKLQDQDTNATAITGGYIVKIDRNDTEANFTPPQIGTIRPTPAVINFTDPAFQKTDTDPRHLAQINYFRNYVLNFLTNLSSASYTNPVTGYAQYIDPDQWVNHLLANIIPFNVDGYRLSGFMYKDRLGRLEQGPMWDCDRCMGTGGTATPQGDNRAFSPRYWRLPANDVGTDNGTDFFGVSNVGVSWFSRLFSDPDFWQRFIDRYQMTRTNEYSSNSIVTKLDGFYNEIKEAQVREQNRWGGTWQGVLQSFTYPRAGVQTVNGYTFDFGPADNQGRGRFTNEVNFQKRWLLDRLDFIDTNFLNMPILSSGSALVPSGTSFTAAPAAKAGSILLYTLDGTDPRLPGGAVSPSARTNIGTLTFTITNNTRFIARSYNTSHANMTNSGTEVGKPLINSFWSGPAAATYYTGVPSLAITEIMFHPEGPAAGDTNDNDNFEYIELKNLGANTLNLVGFRFTNGIDFTFTASSGVTSLAPGEYVLVVKSIQAFTNRYGAALLSRIAGEFAGNLDNSGERLTLVGPTLEPVFDFEYRDSWFKLADGTGFSLVSANENAPFSSYTNAASWRISSLENGSPGVVDPAPLSIPIVIVSEAFTHSTPLLDTVEVQNLTSSNIDIGGWYLSDDFGNPKKYQIASPTFVSSGGFMLFNESQFSGGSNGFILSSEGDSVYLFSASGGLLSGYYHGFSFGAAENGVTFIRYLTSQTNEEFVASATNSLGFTNSLPRVGPVVISEISYHPPERLNAGVVEDNSLDEFVELHNISATSVPLYHTNYPTNTWKLTKGTDFVFPTNITMPPNGYLLVVNFDPATNLTQLAAFKSKYSVPNGTPIYGPYGGKLDNSEDVVKLVRPDVPNPSTRLAPYIQVDRIHYYDNTNQWVAAADGFGPSLQRVVEARYGNDPTNWAAGFPTPGQANAGGNPPQITQQPSNVIMVETTSTNLSLIATGAPPLSYQWRFNGSALPGETNAVLNIVNASPANGGAYAVAVFNGGGAVVSITVTVSVVALPKFTLQPANQTPAPGSNVTVSVMAFGTGPLSYQWRLNGTNILGATSSNLFLPNVQLNDAGIYDVTVTDLVGTTLSQSATVIVYVKPFVIVPPVSVTVLQRRNVSMSVVAGPVHPLLPLSYQWLLTGGAIGTPSNATTATLTILNCQTNGQVRLRVSNVAGTTNLIGMNVTVLKDFDNDGIADIWEVQYGMSTNNSADASLDSDGDGMNNRDEYLSGTNPTNALSVLTLDLTPTNSSVLQFTAQSNISYMILMKTNLNSDWNNVSNVAPQNAPRSIRFPDGSTNSQRYYRVLVP